MQHNKIMLVTTDNHTLGIQTVASIICRGVNILPVMFYLPSNLPEYPPQIEANILQHINREIMEYKSVKGTVLFLIEKPNDY